MKKYPTQERLKSIINYDPHTGFFTWLDRESWPPEVRKRRSGKVAGNHSHGYIVIGVDGVQYPAHRLAWIYINGDIGSLQIDHKDMNRSNNKLENLRIASTQEQRFNSRKYTTNKSGHKGVSCYKKTSKWQAQIQVNKKQIFLGIYETPEEAHAAYCGAAKKYHGEFARFA